MKDTLEYKILKYLSENDNGQYINVSDLHLDKILLRSKLNGLSKEKLILYSPPIDIRFGDGDNFIIDNIKAKIEFKGIEFLNKLETVNKNITNNFNSSTIGQLNQESEFFESVNKIKTNAATSRSPVIKSRLNIILSNPWFIGISLALLAAIFNGKRFMSFINSILDYF